MACGGGHDVVAAAQQRLEALKYLAEAIETEQGLKEGHLRQLQRRLEDLQREKESVRDRTREVSADTAVVLNELRAVEELEMLDNMLVEKNTQLLLRQVRQDSLLQQLANMEATIEDSAHVKRWRMAESTSEVQASECEAEWEFFCGRLRRRVDGVDRCCLGHTFHLVNHPVSVFHQSLRKMYRMACNREEELALQLESVDAQLEHATSLDDALRGIEADYKHEMGGLERGNQDEVQALEEAASVENMELCKALQEAMDTRRLLIGQLQAKGFDPVGDEFQHPSLIGVLENAPLVPSDQHDMGCCENSVNGSSGGTEKTSLRSAVILQRPRLSDGGSASEAGVFNAATTVGATATSDAVVKTISPVGDSAPTGKGAGAELLKSQVAAAERDVHRLQQGYETLKEEADRAVREYKTSLNALEVKLRAACDAVAVLQKEKSEWEALQQQMSLMVP
ncbi:hypothetical protein DQ04_01091040 [Trypanosoma grayi]|uniref:hypothetical protein n=1 Tax=Trypanosoma grayi TaxID=71804 RepID=UPI0004F481FF|nr:hypothetical protein DQ04_01091040 [Trypanosoma grayi]KEG13297.1 hypothetical protein DQ04_01091040 [Trypanosoma grayi]